MAQVTPPLVEQPTAAPTRKLTFDAIASFIVLVVGIIVQQTSDLPLDPIAEGGGLAFLMLIVGKVVGYFTKNRQT